MNPQKRFCFSGSVALALVLLMVMSACLVSGSSAQSTGSSSASSTLSGDAPVPFLVAPSLSLAGAPTSVAIGDLNQDGKLDLVTTDAISGKVTVFIGDGKSKFAPGVEYATGFHPGSVAVADLDGSGQPEVIVADETKGTISVLEGIGGGALHLKQTVVVGIAPTFIATGDFNGDGRTDLVVAERRGGFLAVLINDGKGNLQGPVLSSLHKAPTALTIADFNNDAHADVALANADGTVSILLGTGNGGFRAIPDLQVVSGSLSSIVSEDFNRDGNVDLAVTQPGAKIVIAFQGKGDGTFTAPANYSVGINPVFTVSTDLDGDGIPDLIAINQGSNTMSVLGGNGDGTFKNSVDFVVGKGPLSGVAGDFDGDGHMDLAVINSSSQSVSIALGNGDGTFKASRSYPAGMKPRAVASADLNGDKLPDLVVTNYCGSDSTCSKGGSVAVFLAGKDGSYQLSDSYPLGAGPVSVALVDVNGDKLTDIVALNRQDKTVSVLLGKGDGRFEQPFTISVTDAPIAVAVGDFNKDDKPDLAVLSDCGTAKCSEPGSVEILLGQGGGSFATSATYPVGYLPVSIAVGDLNGDKTPDIVVANSCGTDSSCKSRGTATVLLGSANGKFKAEADLSIGNSPSSIALGDLSGRGVLDLLVASSSDNSVSVLKGKGDGSFEIPTSYEVGNSPVSLAIADFNGDGKPDVAVANLQDSTVSILYGKGDSTLATSFALPVGTGPESLTAVAGANSTRVSLATANGNTASAVLGKDVTVLANIGPDAGPADTSLSVTLVVTPPTTVAVNQAFTLEATVSPVGTPAGTVSFFSANNGGTATLIPDCSATAALNSSGVASCTTSALPAGTDSITADYSGDSTNPGTTPSNAVSETVSQLTSTVTLTSSKPTSSTVNDSVIFTATVSSSSGPSTPTTPGGTATFTLNGTTISSCKNVTVTAGVATCTLNNLVATTASTPSKIGATYSGDNNYSSGAATALTQTVNPLSATLNIASSLPTSTVNQSVTFTATLSVGESSTTPITPSGTVSFTVNKVAIAGCTSVAQNAGGTWTCTTSSLLGSSTTDAIAATYGSDSNYTVATAGSFSQTVNALPATLILSSSAVALTFDQSVTFTATLSATALTPVLPSGTVSFTVNKLPSADCPPQTIKLVSSVWTATCTTQSLVTPADVIGAIYNGDTSYTVSAPPTLTQSVNQAQPQVTVTSSLPTSSVNESVKFTATVQLPGVPTLKVAPGGTVTFTQGSTTLCTSAPLSGNPATATCNFAFSQIIASPGAQVSAAYSGDTNFFSASSGSLTNATQIVIPTNTKTTLTSSPSTSSVNETVVFTATITPAFSGTATPQTGSVVFTDATGTPTVLCNKTVTAGVAPTCTTAFTSAGPHTITAAFTSTDGNFNSSPPSANYTQNVSASPTFVVVTSGLAPSAVNQPVTFSATVTASTSGLAIPQGSVTYTDTLTSTVLCSALTLVSGVAPNCTAALPAAGTHTIVATFTPSNTNFQTATSGVLNQIVNADATTATVIASPSASTVDQPVTFTVTITPSFSGATHPKGTVSFSYVLGGTTIVLCSTPQFVKTSGSTSSATCTAPFPAASTYTVTAAYTSGDGNFLGSTAAPLTQTVNASSTSVTVSTPSPTPSSVNQTVSFTAVVAPISVTDTGLTLPTGSVTFSDATAGTLCTSTLAADGTVPACKATLGTAGPHSITAVYSGDNNFSTSTSANAFTQTVNRATTTISVVSSSLTTVVTQAVTYTATVVPSFTGTAPTGAVTFSLTEGGASYGCVATATLPAGGSAPYVESCTINFPNTVSGNVNVTATYLGDTNFSGSTSAAITQTVQNFSSSVTPGQIVLTQGSSTTANTNLTDPFSATPILLTSTALNGFTDPVAVIACTVEPDSSGNAIPGLSCAPVASPTPATGIAVITATSAVPIGTYTVQLTVGDAKVPTLAHQVGVSVDVISLATQATTPIVGTATATFNLAAPLPSGATLSFGNISIVNSDGTYTNIPMTEVGIQLSSITPVSGSSTAFSFVVTAGTTVKAQLTTSRTAFAAAALGVPILFAMSLLPGARNRRRTWLRYLGMVLLAVAVMQGVGCSSGGFTRSSATVGVVGSYVIQIQSTQNGTTTTVAVVPLLIEQ
jgi:VCBS repeat protein/Big-like domain-containing protein